MQDTTAATACMWLGWSEVKSHGLVIQSHTCQIHHTSPSLHVDIDISSYLDPSFVPFAAAAAAAAAASLPVSAGEPAPEKITDKIYGETQKVNVLKMAEIPDIDLSKVSKPSAFGRVWGGRGGASCLPARGVCVEGGGTQEKWEGEGGGEHGCA